MAKNAKSKSEFRHKNTKDGRGHPTYIYREQQDQYEYLSLTHAETTKGKKNVPLSTNPNPKDKRRAYIRPEPGRAHKTSFGSKLKGWFFSKEDKAIIEKIKK